MKPTVQHVFDRELCLIRDQSVYLFVTEIFEKLCPSYFWHIPASQRGHHLPLCRTRGGLVHHVKLAVRFAVSFMEMYPYPPDKAHDEVIAAVLLHDMLKRGIVENELVTFRNHKVANTAHGIFCAVTITQLWDSSDLRKLIEEDRALRIIEAVRRHMGQWTHDYHKLEPLLTEEMRVVVQTTHLADYAASRSLHKWIGERHTDSTMEYLK